MPFIWHIFGYFAKNPYLILSHLSLGLLMFIAQSLLSKTSWLSESTVPINLHHCNPYKVLVHSADVAASQGCSCDSFSMTLCTFKHRKRICTYLSHIYKDFIIIRDYVRLSRNLYIHYVRSSTSKNLSLSTQHLNLKGRSKLCTYAGLTCTRCSGAESPQADAKLRLKSYQYFKSDFFWAKQNICFLGSVSWAIFCNIKRH